eukprot:g2483.t1
MATINSQGSYLTSLTLQETKLDKEATAVEEKYPMYGIPVKELLALDEWVPHQDLLAAGKLRELGHRADEKIIFVSHQWCSFDHPDPAGEQLRALQGVLRKLADGEMVARTNPILELGYSYKRIDGPEGWRDYLENGFVWHDFSCIPQPLAYKNKMEKLSKLGRVGTEAPPPSDKGSPVPIAVKPASHAGMPASKPASHAGMPAPKPASHAGMPASKASHAGMLSADHRQGNSDDDAVIKTLTAQLTAAVDSIPAYVERSSAMWVLVPPVAHQDVHGAICNYMSWRTRGWCRMEFAASNLTTKDMPVLLIRNACDAPEYVNPCDVPKLSAANGTFSYEEDRAKVERVLTTMVRNKVRHFEEMGDMTMARVFRCFAPILTGRVDRTEPVPPAPAAGAGAGAGAAAAAVAEAEDSAVDRLKRRLKWRDEATEAAWVKETGINLMTMAAALDDLDAVKELCARPEAVALMSIKGKKISTKGARLDYRRYPAATLMLGDLPGTRPLMPAMAFASKELVETMLRAGCPVPKGHSLSKHIMGPIFSGKMENVDALAALRPGVFDPKTFTSMGWNNLLHMTMGFADTRNAGRMLDWALEKGCELKLLHKRNGFGMTPLTFHCMSEDADGDMVRRLVALDPAFGAKDINTPNKLMKAMKVVVKMVKGLAGVSGTMATAGRMMQEFMMGGTALHAAAYRGNMPVIQALLELGADPTIRARGTAGGPCQGLTPYEIICLRFPDSQAPVAMAHLLESHDHAACVTQAAKHETVHLKLQKKALKFAQKVDRKEAAAAKKAGAKAGAKADSSGGASKKYSATTKKIHVAPADSPQALPREVC